jgi:hypothetical protein
VSRCASVFSRTALFCCFCLRHARTVPASVSSCMGVAYTATAQRVCGMRGMRRLRTRTCVWGDTRRRHCEKFSQWSTEKARNVSIQQNGDWSPDVRNEKN